MPLTHPVPSCHPLVGRIIFWSFSLKKLKYRLMIISTMPKIILIVFPSILSRRHIAMVENTTNAATKGSNRFHVTNFIYFSITTVAEVSESNPESVTASPYEGIRKGSAVIMNMPNPKPMVRCTKLAPAAKRTIYRIFSVIF